MPNSRKRHRKPPGPLLKLNPPTKPGAIMRHVVAAGAHEGLGREYYLHATKGYRSRRIADG